MSSQSDAYSEAITSATSNEELSGIIHNVTNPSSETSLMVVRPVIAVIAERLANNEEMLCLTLSRLEAHGNASFEESITLLRESLATLYEKQHDFLEAARTLQGIPLESGQRIIKDDYRLKTYIRITRCLLEADEAISADAYLKRAAIFIHDTSDLSIQLHFKLAQARIFDAKRKFFEASQKYLELSFNTQILESERMNCLDAAMTCGILAPAGPARSRLLSTIYKDERAQLSSQYRFLEKMFLDRIIKGHETQQFSATLRPHQLALLGDGTTVVSRAVIEHNILSTSKLYENIGVTELGALLDLEPLVAEEYVRTMIETDRLAGEIDQVSGIIDFMDGDTHVQGGSEIARWDSGIKSLLNQVEDCSAELEKLYPDWYQAQQTARV